MHDTEQSPQAQEPTGTAWGRGRALWVAGWKGLLLTGAALAAHGQALQAPFFMDDHVYIDENRFVIEGNPLDLPEAGATPWRGVTRTVFALVVRLCGGVSPVAFHALNLLLTWQWCWPFSQRVGKCWPMAGRAGRRSGRSGWR